MAYFNRDNQSGGKRNFGKPRFASGSPELHKAICATCGKSCEVPFKPNGSKPVFCRDCFKNSEGSDARGSENRTDRQMHDAVCTNCGANCKIPFRPSAGRDVLCSRCFETNGPIDTRKPLERQSFNRDDRPQNTYDTPDYKAQFEALHTKMDKILHILTSAMAEVPPAESAIDEKVIDEIVEEIQGEKKVTVAKKPKKATKKSSSPKKK